MEREIEQAQRAINTEENEDVGHNVVVNNQRDGQPNVYQPRAVSRANVFINHSREEYGSAAFIATQVEGILPAIFGIGQDDRPQRAFLSGNQGESVPVYGANQAEGFAAASFYNQGEGLPPLSLFVTPGDLLPPPNDFSGSQPIPIVSIAPETEMPEEIRAMIYGLGNGSVVETYNNRGGRAQGSNRRSRSRAISGRGHGDGGDSRGRGDAWRPRGDGSGQRGIPRGRGEVTRGQVEVAPGWRRTYFRRGQQRGRGTVNVRAGRARGDAAAMRGHDAAGASGVVRVYGEGSGGRGENSSMADTGYDEGFSSRAESPRRGGSPRRGSPRSQGDRRYRNVAAGDATADNSFNAMMSDLSGLQLNPQPQSDNEQD